MCRSLNPSANRAITDGTQSVYPEADTARLGLCFLSPAHFSVWHESPRREFRREVSKRGRHQIRHRESLKGLSVFSFSEF